MFEMIQIFFFLFFGCSFFMFIKKLLDLCNSDESFLLEDVIKTTPNLLITKYEDKYLEKYNHFTSNLDLKEDDLKNKEKKYNELLQLFKKTKELALQDIKNEIDELVMTELIADDLNDTNIENCNILKQKYAELQEKKIDNAIEKESYEYMCESYYDKLKNNFLFENTPNGNIIMYYNNENKSFEYYSDKSMPYRFLETAARKYVTTFYCKPLYINMMDELRNAENKMIEDRKEIIKQKEPESKKNVFVKLKNYNKEANKPLPRNKNPMKIPNHIKTKIASIQNQSESHILKENANRYTHKGKISNFIMLKQVDKTKMNKNYSLSYKDYAEMSKK